MQNREAVGALLDEIKPTHVLNAAGSTGRPNVDWCEDHKEDTVRNNVIGTLNLTDCCFERGIHITVFATGCIYAYNDSHPIGGPGFLETDKANFDGSFYSETKAHVEEVSLDSCTSSDIETNWWFTGHEILLQLPHPETSYASL
jgi:3,5-epimerase/4-reductase